MINDLFQAYKLNIITFSPIHIGDMLVFEPTNYVIGNAEEATKPQTQFIICPECGHKNKPTADYCGECDTKLKQPDHKSPSKVAESYLYTFTPKQLSEALSEADKKELLATARSGNFRALQKFFRKKTGGIIPHATRHAKVCSEFYNLYMEKFGNIEEQQGKENKFDIAKNISNQVTNMAYIPASSLKGAIRTALMNKANKKQHLSLDDIKNVNKNGANAEKILYHYENATGDPFKYLKISDTIPTETYMTEICKAQNYIKNASATGVPTYMEVIPQYTDFSAELSIGKKFVENMSSISQACNGFYIDILENEQRYMCNNHNIPTAFFDKIKEELQKENTFLLRVGMHSGAESVTIEGLRRIKVNKEFLTSSTSCWYAENGATKLPFGWCIVTYEEIR